MCRLAELANTKIKWLTKRLVINALTKAILALRKPADETEFSNYERGDEE